MILISMPYKTAILKLTLILLMKRQCIKLKVLPHSLTMHITCVCSSLQELFLVPNHKITDIHGASFAGFYYICLEKSKGSIEGYYYHKMSEWYMMYVCTHIGIAGNRMNILLPYLEFKLKNFVCLLCDCVCMCM